MLSINTTADKTIALDHAVAAAERRFTAANPLSQQRHVRARAVLPGGHSCQTLYYAPFPLTITRGNGAFITDIDAHEYLNLVGDFAAGVFGHRCEPIQRASALIANDAALAAVIVEPSGISRDAARGDAENRRAADSR